jgi:(2Fe-2S) ferredoxin
VPVIYTGMASRGRAAGAGEVLAAVQQTLAEENLQARIVQTGCIGPCYLEPLLDIALPGQPRISFANVTPEQARRIVSKSLRQGEVPLTQAVGHFGDGEGQLSSALPRFFDLPMLRPQVRVVLKNCGFIDPEDVHHYVANDGYAGLMRAFAMGPEAVVEEVKEAGLRGRGGAGFPTYRK